MPRFQLIEPKICDKIYESNNISKCAEKFFNIVKYHDVKKFTMRDIDTNKTYKYEICQKNLQNADIKEDTKEDVKVNIKENIKENTKEDVKVNMKEVKDENKQNLLILNKLQNIEMRVRNLENNKMCSIC